MTTVSIVAYVFFFLLFFLLIVSLCSLAWYPMDPYYYAYYIDERAVPPEEIERGGHVYKLHRVASNGAYRELDL